MNKDFASYNYLNTVVIKYVKKKYHLSETHDIIWNIKKDKVHIYVHRLHNITLLCSVDKNVLFKENCNKRVFI